MTERALLPAKKVVRMSTICQREIVNFDVELPAFQNVVLVIDLDLLQRK